MDFQTSFSWLISKKVSSPVSKFSNRIIRSGLNNGRSKLVLSICPLPLKSETKLSNQELVNSVRDLNKVDGNFERKNDVKDMILISSSGVELAFSIKTANGVKF